MRRNPIEDYGPEEWEKFFHKPSKPPMLPYAPLGSISEGTHETDELLEAFAGTLKDLARHQPDPLTKKKHLKLVKEAEALLDEDDDDERVAMADLNIEIETALEDYAPPYGYFGAHPDDGADFGFWISIDAVNDAIQEARHEAKRYAAGLSDEEPSNLAVEDLDDVPDHFSGEVFLISDHGNVTLYECSLGHLVKIWGIV